MNLSSFPRSVIPAVSACACTLFVFAFWATPARAQNLFLDGPSVQRADRKPADEDSPPASVTPRDEPGRAQSILVGKIIWVDKAGHHAVAWLDSAAPLPAEVLVPDASAKTAAAPGAPATAAAAAVPSSSKAPAAKSAPGVSPAVSSGIGFVPARLLIAVGAKLEPQARLRVAHRNPGERAVGLVVERGVVYLGQEIVLPSPELLTAFSASK